MTAAPSFRYTVSAKVETLYGDGTTKYMFHGVLEMNLDGNGQQFALSVAHDLWDATHLGETLVFPYTHTIITEDDDVFITDDDEDLVNNGNAD